MRVILIFFVVVNIAFFAWQSSSLGGQGAQSLNRLTAIPANVSQLKLIEETGSGGQNPAGKTKAAKDNSRKSPPQKTASMTAPLPAQKRTAKNYTCYALGPFRDVILSTPIARKLRDLGAITNQRRVEKKITTGFWVYLPRYDSWKAARQQVMELEKKGLKDIFIMGRGSMKNAVSVGLFTSKKAANKRVARLKKLGVSPKVQPQHSSTPKYWVDIDVETDKKAVASAIEAIAKGLTQLELETRKCGK